MKQETTNHLHELRTARGISAAELARVTGVRRQTIHAIEAGDYMPNTALALKLSRALDARVEQIFALAGESPRSREIAVEVLGDTGARAVRLCQVGKKIIAVPVSAVPLFLPTAEGVRARANKSVASRVTPFDNDDPGSGNRLLVAGCDPAISVLSDELRRAGIDIVIAPCSSSQALQWLKQGKVHVAGSHLRDASSGDFNVPQIRRLFRAHSFRVVTFAEWEEGFVVAAGNPKGFRGVQHLARPDIRIVNREPGAGARSLLDRVLRDARIPAQRVGGYDSIAAGHLPAAWQVSAGRADCCIASAAAARLFGLHFIPLQAERYDLVVPRRFLGMKAVERLLDILTHARLRRKLELFAGYATAQTGAVRA